LLAVLQLSVPLWAAEEPRRVEVNIERALAIGATDLPQRIDEVTRASFKEEERAREDVFGQFSRVFEYHDGHENAYLVSCDFPFGPDWHDLTVCYRGTGWELTERRVVSLPGNSQSGGGSWDYVEAHFQRPDGTVALLLYCVFDASGEAVRPPSNSIWEEAWRSMRKRSKAHNERILYQFQILTTAAETIHPGQRETAERLLLSARDRMRAAITGQVANTKSQEADLPDRSSDDESP
jgi:hypothetical protein